MSAIITEQLRKQNAKRFHSEVADGGHYISIGKGSPWEDTLNTNDSSPYPAGTYADRRRVLEQSVGMFRIAPTNTQIVIPVNTLQPGRKYKVYDPYDPTCFYADYPNELYPCYVTIPKGTNDTGVNQIWLLVDKKNLDATPGVTEIVSDTAFTSVENWMYKIIQTVPAGGDLNQQHTWVNIGEYDTLNLASSKNFVVVKSDPATTNISVNACAVGSTGNLDDDGNPINTNILTGDQARARTYEQTGGLFYGFSILNKSSRFRTGINTFRDIPITVTFSYATTELDDGVTVKTYGSTTVKCKGRFTNEGLSQVFAFEIITPYDQIYSVFDDIGKLLKITEGEINVTEYAIEAGYLQEYNPQIPLAAGKIYDYGEDSSAENNGYPVFYPRIAPPQGFGWNKLDQLPSWYVACAVDTAANNDIFIPDSTSYRQISIIKNVTQTPEPIEFDATKTADDHGTYLTKDFVLPLRKFTLEGADYAIATHTVGENVGPGDTIIMADSDGTSNVQTCGTIAYVQDTISSSNHTLLKKPIYYYYPDIGDGFATIEKSRVGDDGELIDKQVKFKRLGSVNMESDPYIPVIGDAAEELDLKTYKYDGDVLFMDNRSAITREEGQNEELRMIIQF